jgi:hypothetical protein
LPLGLGTRPHAWQQGGGQDGDADGEGSRDGEGDLQAPDE